MSGKESQIAITAEDLKALLLTVIEEAKKPVVTEADKRRISEEQEARRDSMASIELEAATKKHIQDNVCDHRRHGKINEGSSRCVVVKVNHDEFLICQQCQKIIRRDTEPRLFMSLYSQDSAVQW